MNSLARTTAFAKDIGNSWNPVLLSIEQCSVKRIVSDLFKKKFGQFFSYKDEKDITK